MYLLALAADYDGTIAEDGVVDAATLDALTGLKETGRRLLLISGRELGDLKTAFAHLSLFDRVVAENGAVVFHPGTGEEQALAPPPPAAFVEALRRKNVTPLTVGTCIVATVRPHENTVLEVIRDLGLELQIIFNKGAVMALPSGVNKAVGLETALRELELARHNVIAVGDAENDYAALRACGCSAAVANALPMLKQAADIVLEGAHGRGVVELIGRICAEDAALIPPGRHGIRVGVDRAGREARLDPYFGGVLIAGGSGAGKSTLATALTERMSESGYEFCVLDPEGDYGSLERTVSIGRPNSPPDMNEIMQLVQKVGVNVAINVQALGIDERPTFFASLLPALSALRARTGRPHWVIIDEAHHFIPAQRADVPATLPKDIPAAVFITVHPRSMAVEALRTVRSVLTRGRGAAAALAEFCEAIGADAPAALPELDDNEAFLYSAEGVSAVGPDLPRQAHKRHKRKYAEGEIEPDRSFYFRGPDSALNLRAQNLSLFAQIANGVDDRTWEHHRSARDYSAWFRHTIKNEDLAAEAAEIEGDPRLDAPESRKRMIEAVARRYAAAAKLQQG